MLQTSLDGKTNAGLEHYDGVLRSAQSMFDQLCGMALRHIGESVEEDLTADGALLSIISLGCPAFQWSIILGVSGQTALAVAERFAGFPIEFDSEDMGDAMGEMANIFAGLIQKELGTRGVQAEISLPSIMRGQNLDVLSQAANDTRSTFFDSDAGKLWIAVIAQPTEQAVLAPAAAGEPKTAAAVPVSLTGSTQTAIDQMQDLRDLKNENEALKQTILDQAQEISKLRKQIEG